MDEYDRKYINTKFIKTTNMNRPYVGICVSSGNIYYIFGKVQWVMFVSVNFSVMFKFFGHIHSVILNWSSDYFSTG